MVNIEKKKITKKQFEDMPPEQKICIINDIISGNVEIIEDDFIDFFNNLINVK